MIYYGVVVQHYVGVFGLLTGMRLQLFHKPICGRSPPEYSFYITIGSKSNLADFALATTLENIQHHSRVLSFMACVVAVVWVLLYSDANETLIARKEALPGG